MKADLGLRELQVLELIAQGYSYAGAAKQLRISRHTVHSQLRHIYEKLGAKDAANAVHIAHQTGILE